MHPTPTTAATSPERVSPAPALVTISITITEPRATHIDAGNALRKDLTQAAAHYGITPNPIHPDYALSSGQILFGRDWPGNGTQRTTWVLDRVPAELVARVSGALMRTWARQVAQHCGPDAIVEFGGAFTLGERAPVERVAA